MAAKSGDRNHGTHPQLPTLLAWDYLAHTMADAFLRTLRQHTTLTLLYLLNRHIPAVLLPLQKEEDGAGSGLIRLYAVAKSVLGTVLSTPLSRAFHSSHCIHSFSVRKVTIQSANAAVRHRFHYGLFRPDDHATANAGRSSTGHPIGQRDSTGEHSPHLQKDFLTLTALGYRLRVHLGSQVGYRHMGHGDRCHRRCNRHWPVSCQW